MNGRTLRCLFRRVTLSRPLVYLYDFNAVQLPLGKRGEREAERFLLRLGMIIVARSYQDKFGEIDLIAVDDDTIVFVEVKTRSSDVAGSPSEAIDEVKRRRLTQTAKRYLKWHGLTECRVRFDVIAITWPAEHNRPMIDHFRNAFEAVGEFQIY